MLTTLLPTLQPHERTILRLKSLIGAATGKTVFMDCLNRLPGSSARWSNKTLTAELESLRDRKVLTADFACPPELLHPLAIDALESAEGAAMVEAIRFVLPQDSARTWDRKAMEDATLRCLRLAILTNDEAGYQKAAEFHKKRTYSAAPSPFEAYFTHITVGKNWLASRTLSFQIAILQAKADHWLGTGIAAPDYAELMELCRNDAGLRHAAFPLLADYHLLTGQLTRLADILAATPENLPPDIPLAYGAARELLTGNVNASLPLFAEAQKLYLKGIRKRKGALPGYMGLLHLCALLAADDSTLHSEIEAQTELKGLTLGHIAIRALLEMARNKHGVAAEIMRANLATLKLMPALPPVSTALMAAASVQIDPTLIRNDVLKSFDPLFRKLEQSMPLAAGILAEALERTSPDPAPYRSFLARPDRETSFRFAALIATKAPWERALECIEAMLSPAWAKPEAAPKTKRLIWQVDPVTSHIQPMEQARQVRGWSAGRAISLKRLCQGDSKLDYLDSFDMKAVRSIYRSTLGWGGYGPESFECRPERTLPALVGHPRVFSARAPSQNVELVEGRAELVVSSDKGGFRLALSHAAVQPGAFIEIEAPNRWRVVVVDEKAVAAAAILSEKGVSIPKSARDRLAALTQATTPALPLRVDTAEIEDVSAIDGDCTPVVRLAPFGEGLKVSLVVRPAGIDGPHFLPGIGGRLLTSNGQRVRRDLDDEKTRARALAQSCPSLGGDGPEWVLEDQVACLDLLAELQSLPAAPALEWPEGQKFAVRGEASAKKLKASVKGTDNWFTLGGTVQVDEGLVLDLKDLLSRLDRMQGRFVPLDDGGFVALDRHFRQQLDRLRRLGNDGKIPAVAGVAMRDLLQDAASVKSDARWKSFTSRLDEAENWSPTLHMGFGAELREYQMDGFAWMSRLSRWGAGALLADDMGLGKTVQTIAVMMTKAAQGPILVVAPTSVCGNWVTELTRFAPGLRSLRLAESGGRDEVLKSLSPGDVLIASYGLLTREEEKLADIPWSMAILDEAQAIKNAETQRAKACQRLNAEFRLALTGTPVENSLDELWSIFRFINPGLLGSREAFAKRFAIPIERDKDVQAKAALKALVQPFLLRRTKALVLSELPARTEQTLWIERSEEERAFYEALRRTALERLEQADGERTRIHILAEITKLRQACCHPDLATPDAGIPAAKLDAFLELVTELREGRHRALVFSQFVGHLGKIRAALDKAGLSYQYLDGSTPAAEREKRVAAFQAGQGDLFLISLKAGGFGLNLTAADYVIHLDPWWNPAVEDQASDRAHRIGQQRPVTIYRLIVKDSIEEGIIALHQHKRDLADALLDGADASGRLSEEELLRLIKGGE